MDPRLQLYKEARGHIEILIQKQVPNGELEGLLARCLLADKDYENAAKAYEASVAHQPNLLESYAGLAFVRRTTVEGIGCL